MDEPVENASSTSAFFHTGNRLKSDHVSFIVIVIVIFIFIFRRSPESAMNQKTAIAGDRFMLHSALHSFECAIDEKTNQVKDGFPPAAETEPKSG